MSIHRLIKKVIYLLVQGMLACVRAIHSHIIIRDSESRQKGNRYCREGAEKDKT
jgi:hypothetical protein